MAGRYSAEALVNLARLRDVGGFSPCTKEVYPDDVWVWRDGLVELVWGEPRASDRPESFGEELLGIKITDRGRGVLAEKGKV